MENTDYEEDKEKSYYIVMHFFSLRPVWYGWLLPPPQGRKRTREVFFFQTRFHIFQGKEGLEEKCASSDFRTFHLSAPKLLRDQVQARSGPRRARSSTTAVFSVIAGVSKCEGPFVFTFSGKRSGDQFIASFNLRGYFEVVQIESDWVEKFRELAAKCKFNYSRWVSLDWLVFFSSHKLRQVHKYRRFFVGLSFPGFRNAAKSITVQYPLR